MFTLLFQLPVTMSLYLKALMIQRAPLKILIKKIFNRSAFKDISMHFFISTPISYHQAIQPSIFTFEGGKI